MKADIKGEGFVFYGTRKLTNFRGGKRKYGIYFNGFRTKRYIILEIRKTKIFDTIVTDIGNQQYIRFHMNSTGRVQN